MQPTKRANRRILFVDMNSFFASCEQAENPALHDKPVIVVPTKGSSALSASYEAKAFGIRTGTSEKDARFLCPNVITVACRPKVYMDYHRRLTTILENISPNVSMRSVDEGAIRLCRNEDPLELAKEIKEQIWKQLGSVVRCSIGIAPNVFLAKLATEMQKPNGLTEITLEGLEQAYQQVKLRDFCGINYAMERQLNRINIYSPLDFYRADAAMLRQSLGIIGHRWWLKMHGYEIDEYHTHRKSLSHSHVLPPTLRNPKQAYTTLQRLVMKVGHRLRKEKLMAQHISLYIRYVDKTSFGHHFQITPCNDTLTLSDHIKALWERADPQVPILKLAIWTHDLTPAVGIPIPLFPNEQKRSNLAQAIDTINDTFGTETIHFAITTTEGSRAPDRISFNALFDIEYD